jgi:cellulose biosynthesis protein BcsQ
MSTTLLPADLASGRAPQARHPLTMAIAHCKGGVGKTTTTLILGRYLARRRRVALRDYDDGQHLSALVRDISPDGVLTNRLWLADGSNPTAADVVLIDSAPARSHDTRQALVEADYILIPAPPERQVVRSLHQMLDIIDEVRSARVGGNPFVQILGVVPTLYDKKWPIHTGFLDEMRAVCVERQVRVFPPVLRRQSYQMLSLAGQDYEPVAAAIEQVAGRRRA